MVCGGHPLRRALYPSVLWGQTYKRYTPPVPQALALWFKASGQLALVAASPFAPWSHEISPNASFQAAFGSSNNPEQ